MSTKRALCSHEWRMAHDWGGTPGIPNGTFEILYKKCTVCGEEMALEPGDERKLEDDSFPDDDDGRYE